MKGTKLPIESCVVLVGPICLCPEDLLIFHVIIHADAVLDVNDWRKVTTVLIF